MKAFNIDGFTAGIGFISKTGSLNNLKSVAEQYGIKIDILYETVDGNFVSVITECTGDIDKFLKYLKKHEDEWFMKAMMRIDDGSVLIFANTDSFPINRLVDNKIKEEFK
jgi:hypothetical protein